MKKILAIILSMVLIISVCPLGLFSITASAAKSGYYMYEVSNGEATITYCDQSIRGDVIIPSSLGGYPVTSIGDFAFDYCISLESIIIPDSVTSIGERAFNYCYNLTSVTIPDSVTSIGAEAFYYCHSLKSVTIPESITSIEKGTFSSCFNLKSVTIPDSVTSIGEEAFYYCSNLTSVTIPANITSIEEGTFSGCENLTSITIPDGVTSIGENAFSCCERLTSITIPDSVKSIGDYAFTECESLTGVIIPDSVTSIGDNYAFGTKTLLYGYKTCSALVNYAATHYNEVVYIDAPDEESIFSGKIGKNNWSIDKRIGELLITGNGPIIDFTSITPPWDEYSQCITKIVISDGVTSIGDAAFESCYSLKSITIPDSVTSIGDYAFKYCDSLTSITIPNSVTSIGCSAFFGCTSLKSVTIPYGVSYIYSDTFYMNNIENIYIFNKDCYFDYDCGLYYNQTIYGFVGSTAETYAEKIGAGFIDIMTVHTHTWNDNHICTECGTVDYVIGDVYGVEGVTDRDAVYLLYHTFLSDIYPVNQDCDFNGDGEVNDKDAVYLLYHTFLPDLYPIN